MALTGRVSLREYTSGSIENKVRHIKGDIGHMSGLLQMMAMNSLNPIPNQVRERQQYFSDKALHQTESEEIGQGDCKPHGDRTKERKPEGAPEIQKEVHMGISPLGKCDPDTDALVSGSGAGAEVCILLDILGYDATKHRGDAP